MMIGKKQPKADYQHAQETLAHTHDGRTPPIHGRKMESMKYFPIYVTRWDAVDIPMLMLLRQNGDEAQGWCGTPFYWPLIWAQQNVRTAIFSHESRP
jgi:hypothetical protein